MQVEFENDVENQKKPSYIPWSLLGVEGRRVTNTNCAASDATGTATHSLNQPKDLNVDDS